MIEAGGDFFQDLAGPMSLRAQVADHDATVCPSLSGESARGSGNSGRVHCLAQGGTKLAHMAQTAGTCTREY